MATQRKPKPEAESERKPEGQTQAGPKTLAPLPYETSALEPVISRRTLELHYGKHHKGYLDKLNALIAGTELADLPLTEIIRATAADSSKTKIFNNAAQVWNHDVYWRSLSPKGGGPPPAELARRAEESFGSFADMERRFAEAAIGLFGSGYVWLVEDGQKLRILETSNADNPLVLGMNTLLTLDVWEHAYYVDYENRRDEHVKAVLARRINWAYAVENLGRGGA